MSLLAAQVLSPRSGCPFLHDMLDLAQTGEWRTLYEAMDNAARIRGRRAVVAAVAARACAESPTFVIVEDLHWADVPLLGHLAALASALADGAGLMVHDLARRRRSDRRGLAGELSWNVVRDARSRSVAR